MCVFIIIRVVHSWFSFLLFHTQEFISSGIPIVPPLASWYYIIDDQKPSTNILTKKIPHRKAEIVETTLVFPTLCRILAVFL